MKVTFFSNFLNHHQLPFCLAMDRLTGGNFTFVATTLVPQEQLDMGYHDMNRQYPFVLTTYDSKENSQLAKLLVSQSDVLIIGSAPGIDTRLRLEQGKLTFRCTERIFKRGLLYAFSPRIIRAMVKNHRKYQDKPLYVLCASAYTAYDFSLFGVYHNKTFKWGYFPEVKKQDPQLLFSRKGKNKTVSILWAGRLIGWKHPETAVLIAERLKKAGYCFEMSIIGSGVMEQALQNMIAEMQLGDCVHMLGSMPPEAVREHMERADIFLFTSDFNEGWGAVLNESMNSGCAVVASHAIGSVPFLIQNGVNGFIYRNGDMEGLYSRVEQLIQDPALREKIGRNAYLTMAEQWNADIAADRFLQLSQALLDGKSPDLFDDGPCSRAKILKNGWYR